MAASVLLAALLCEAALRLFLPKYRDVAEGRLQADDLRIFAPVPNTRDWSVHPDTRQRHPVHTNNLGLRQHREFSEADLVAATTVGVFGDSFVQTPYLDAPYIFTEPLDYLLNLDADFTVLNFGVFGYGPAQSYFTYRSFHAREALDYVLFVYFGGNDLLDLAQNGLFDLDDDGLLRQREARGSAWWVPFASRLHLTYLALDAAGRLAPYLADLATQLQTEYDAWDLGIVSSVGDDSLDASREVFGQLIRRWRREVEGSGGKFFVALLPTQPDYPLVRPLLEDAGIGVVDLNACFAGRDEGHRRRNWDHSPYRLRDDYHWNELGNQLAAACLDDLLRREAGLPTMAEAMRDAALAAYYAAFEPSTGAAGEQIRRRYQALGGSDAAYARIESSLSPDKLVVSNPANHYDVYLDGSLLVFVKGDCHDDNPMAYLCAVATPVDAGVLPPDKSYSFPCMHRYAGFPMRDKGRCLLKWEVPPLVSHLLVGQWNHASEVLWSGEVFIDRAAFEGVLTAMLAAAGEPVIESDMDVHVHGRRIFYVSDDCERTDGRTRFLLHVTPVREADLPADRIEHGFANHDFNQAGVTLGERCVVRWQLPDYPIRHIRTGQYVKVQAAEDVRYAKLWEGEADLGG